MTFDVKPLDTWLMLLPPERISFFSGHQTDRGQIVLIQSRTEMIHSGVSEAARAPLFTVFPYTQGAAPQTSPLNTRGVDQAPVLGQPCSQDRSSAL